MNYLIAVLPNRIQAEAAYSKLEQDDVPMSQVSLLGRGYQSADEFGFIDPNQQAKKWSRRLAYLTVPFGFVAGYQFNLLTQIELLSWAGDTGNHLFAGLIAAGSGAIGALFVGGAVGWTVASGDAIAYRNRLNNGKYLIVAQGTDQLIRQATRILRQFEPENLQGYAEPVTS